MSENSIVAIIVAFIGAFGGTLCKVIEKGLLKNKTREKGQTSLLNIMFFTGITISILSLGIFIYSQFNPEPASIPAVAQLSGPSLEITSPADNEKVDKTIRVEGWSKDLGEQRSIWIFVYPYAVNRYFPQNSSAELEANNRWSSLSYIGQDKNVGQKFDICLVLVDEKAKAAIETYLEEARNKEDWPGLEKLPEGAVKYDTVTVVRK